MFIKAPRFTRKAPRFTRRIVPTLSLLSKMKRKIWFPKFLTLDLFLERHRVLNVDAIASVFRARLVKNLAVIMNSIIAISSTSLKTRPSLLKIESPLH